MRRWTRNLIVGGAYGLVLGTDVQRRTPPFRDGYQTSTFVATSAALQIPVPEAPTGDGEKADGRTRGAQRMPLQKPDAELHSEKAETANPSAPDFRFLGHQRVQLYEVGRTHLVPLLPDAGQSTHRGRCDLIQLALCKAGGLQPQYLVLTQARRIRVALALVWVVSAAGMLGWAFKGSGLGKTSWSAGPVMSGVFFFGLVVSLLDFGWLLWQVGYPEQRAMPPEPLFFSEGVSSWPIALLWSFALALTCMFLLRIARTIRPGLEATRAQYLGEFTEGQNGKPVIDYWERLRTLALAGRPTVTLDDPAREPFAEVWGRYQSHARGWRRVARIAFIWAVLFLLPFLLVHGIDLIPPPVIRGPFQRDLLYLDYAHCVMLTVLMAAVADSAILCTLFVLDLGSQRTEYSKDVLDAICARTGLCPELTPYLDEYIDCEVIGERTAAVARFLYYPFIVLGVLAISMTSLFDDWVFSPARVSLYALYVGVLLMLWLGLHWTATRARYRALSIMELMWIDLQRDAGRDRQTAETFRRQFPLLLSHVRDLQIGAYGPLLAQPVFRALLWPLGSLSSTQLIQYLFLR